MILRFGKFLCLLVLSFSLVSAAKIQKKKPSILSSYWVSPQSETVMGQIADRFEVVEKKDGRFKIIVPKNRVAELKGLEKNIQIELDDIHSIFEGRIEKNRQTVAGYRSYSEVLAYLEELARQHPDFIAIETYGYSQQNNPLVALKISDNVAVDEDEPELMLTAATHGDELITVEVLLGLIDQIVSGYATDDRFKQMIENREMYFIPVINPDGFIRQSRYANGVDPNRDYPWPDQPERDSVDCIKHLRSFYADHQFEGTMDFHAYGEMIMYPWAYTYRTVNAEADRHMNVLTTSMAEENRYRHGQISDVIYVAKGSSADYYFWKK